MFLSIKGIFHYSETKKMEMIWARRMDTGQSVANFGIAAGAFQFFFYVVAPS
jgi:hypothetical protein